MPHRFIPRILASFTKFAARSRGPNGVTLHVRSVWMEDGENGYSIEVFNALGDTIAVTAVGESALEPLSKNEVLSVRPLSAAS